MQSPTANRPLSTSTNLPHHSERPIRPIPRPRRFHSPTQSYHPSSSSISPPSPLYAFSKVSTTQSSPTILNPLAPPPTRLPAPSDTNAPSTGLPNVSASVQHLPGRTIYSNHPIPQTIHTIQPTGSGLLAKCAAAMEMRTEMRTMARRANLDLELNGYRDARGYDADESDSGSGEDGGDCEEGWGDEKAEEEARAQGGEVGSVGDSVEAEVDDAMAVDKVEFEVEESMDVDIDQEAQDLEVGTRSEVETKSNIETKSDAEKNLAVEQPLEIVYKKPAVIQNSDVEPYPLSRLTPSMRQAYEWVDPSDESAVETPEESDEEDGEASPGRESDAADDADGEDEWNESDGASSFYGPETEDTEASSSDVDSVEMERARLEEDAERERQEDEALPESEESAVETASDSDDSDASDRVNADEHEDEDKSGSGSDASTLYGPESEDTVEDNADRVSLVETEPESEPEEDGGATSSGSFDFCEWWATYLDIRALFNEPRW